MRHGDRTPTSTYANDPYKNYDWPGGWGALTVAGKNQLYNVGSRLATYYSKLLPKVYSPDSIYVKSSDSDRCHMSTAVALAALYPPSGTQIWNEKLLWQPIPIHSLPRELDPILAMKKLCAKFDQDLKNSYASPEITKINEENADLYKYLTINAGQNFTTITNVEEIHTNLEIQEIYGLKLPEWVHKVYPNRTLPLMKKSLTIFSHTDFMKRIRGGSFIKEVIDKMISKRDGTLQPNRQMFLYGAHDITIVHVLRTLGFTDLMKPNYGDNLIFELHENSNFTNDMEIKLKYYNSTDLSIQPYPILLNIHGCGVPCLLNNFTTLLTPMLPTDFDQECQN